MSKYCPNCGTEVADNVANCTNCGVAFVQQAATQAPAQTVIVQNVVVQQKTNGLALTGFILSLVSNIVCCGCLNLPALVFSILGMVFAKKNNEKGFGLALAGLIITGVFMIVWIILSIIFSAALEPSYYY